jgi:hypothetical protein
MKSVSREQLYRELWAEPALIVAKRYGISDVGLAKVCERFGVPKPGLGYWAQRRVGKAPAPTPLPPTSDPRLATVYFYGESKPTTPAKEVPEYEREKDPEWRVLVPEDLRLSHPLVKATAAALREAGKGPRQPGGWADRYRAHLVRPGPGCLDVAVSKPLVPRALRLRQALVSALEKRGYSLSVNDKSETMVRVLDEDFQIALVERQKQVQVSRSYGTVTDIEPSGRLRLRVGPDYSSSGLADDPPRVLEDLLNRFIATLVRRAFQAKQERADREERERLKRERDEERERRWRAQDDERRLRDQQALTEQLRRRRLRTLASQWARHGRVSEFVALVERRIDEERLEGERRESATRWVEWARAEIAKTDPVERVLTDAWPTAPLPPATPMPGSWE